MTHKNKKGDKSQGSEKEVISSTAALPRTTPLLTNPGLTSHTSSTTKKNTVKNVMDTAARWTGSTGSIKKRTQVGNGK